MNEAILAEGSRQQLPVIDLRQICSEVTDYSSLSPIEPSAKGGLKITKVISKLAGAPASDWQRCILWHDPRANRLRPATKRALASSADRENVFVVIDHFEWPFVDIDRDRRLQLSRHDHAFAKLLKRMLALWQDIPSAHHASVLSMTITSKSSMVMCGLIDGNSWAAA